TGIESLHETASGNFASRHSERFGAAGRRDVQGDPDSRDARDLEPAESHVGPAGIALCEHQPGPVYRPARRRRVQFLSPLLAGGAAAYGLFIDSMGTLWFGCGIGLCTVGKDGAKVFGSEAVGYRWVVGTRSWPMRKAISGFAVRGTFACGARVRRSSSGA